MCNFLDSSRRTVQVAFIIYLRLVCINCLIFVRISSLNNIMFCGKKILADRQLIGQLLLQHYWEAKLDHKENLFKYHYQHYFHKPFKMQYTFKMCLYNSAACNLSGSNVPAIGSEHPRS